jgi:hypothetical protein
MNQKDFDQLDYEVTRHAFECQGQLRRLAMACAIGVVEQVT